MYPLHGKFQQKQGNFTLDVNFQIPGKGITAIFGHSGSGKTTLLRCIAGLERASPAFLQVNSHCWQDSERHVFIPTHQRPIGYVFQEANLFPHLSVKQNLEYGFKRVVPEQRKVAFASAIELLGISALLNRSPSKLSGGERQRVAIARALLTSPKLLLMDEPLSALDSNSKREILPYLEMLHTQLSIPVLYVTHSLNEVMRLADHLLVLQAGKLIAAGELLDILTQLDLPFIKSDEAGVSIEAQVVEHDETFHLTYLDFCGGRISVSKENVPLGTNVRIAIKARDVSLSLEKETQSSILNIFVAKILEISENNQGQWTIKLDLHGALLLARITKKSGTLLKLKPGISVYARVKSIALL